MVLYRVYIIALVYIATTFYKYSFICQMGDLSIKYVFSQIVYIYIVLRQLFNYHTIKAVFPIHIEKQ